MPAKRLSMRKIKEVLRLKWSKRLSNRRIASSCGIARPTVSEYLRRAESARLTWPLPASLDDTRLERLLFPPPPHLPAPVRGIPDWARAHQELKQKGRHPVPALAGDRAAHPDGYLWGANCYSRHQC